jgi:hypothetical protein
MKNTSTGILKHFYDAPVINLPPDLAKLAIIIINKLSIAICNSVKLRFVAFPAFPEYEMEMNNKRCSKILI